MPRKTAYSPKRVMIVDHHPMLRRGVAQLINNEPDLIAHCEADNASQALNLIGVRKPDLVVVDLSLPDKSGLELVKDIQVFHPETPVLVFSMHDESLYAERALRAGARGYIMKHESGERLMQAIRQVLGGQIYVSDKISARILELFSGRHPAALSSPVENLSDREFEVFQLIGSGKATREIATHLHLSIKTVEVHRANIKRKLKLKTGADLVRQAIRCVEAQNA